MKFREHRGGWKESSDTQVELPDRTALVEHIKKLLACWPSITVEDTSIVIQPYVSGVEIVILKGYGPVGFIDLP